MPLFGPPMQLPDEQSGHGWMPGTPPSVSPVRKMLTVSGRSRFVAPVLQSTPPDTAVCTACTAQVLTGMVLELGIGNGAPK